MNIPSLHFPIKMHKGPSIRVFQQISGKTLQILNFIKIGPFLLVFRPAHARESLGCADTGV